MEEDPISVVKNIYVFPPPNQRGTQNAALPELCLLGAFNEAEKSSLEAEQQRMSTRFACCISHTALNQYDKREMITNGLLPNT